MRLQIFIKHNDNHGVLLLEALLAILILTVSLSVIIESLVSGYRATVFTADYSKAVILLDNAMFDTLRKRFIESSLQDQGNFPEPQDQFHYELKTVSLSQEGSPAALDEVQGKVAWKSGRKEQEVAVVTWLADISQKEDPSKNQNGPQL